MKSRRKLNITNGPVLPALDMVQLAIESLSQLRLRLCSYVNSESHCDCKRLTPPDQRFIEPHTRSGEFSGCVEVREAIFRLQIVERSITGIDASIKTKSDAFKLFCGKLEPLS